MGPDDIIIIICVAFILAVIFFPRKKEGLTFTLYFDSITIKSNKMKATLTVLQLILGALTPVNKKGEPAPIEPGTVQFSSENPEIADVVEDPENETKFKILGKAEGTTKINFSADADRGEGVVTITGSIDVEVLPAQATGFKVELGEPVEQE